jgi:nicotinate-nucleotide--dimethylbenzimidazole phosphoribosyltransferase
MEKSNNSPFDDIRALVSSVPDAPSGIEIPVLEKLATATGGLKPLGRLDRMVAWLATWQGRPTPAIEKPLIAVFVGTHKVAEVILGVDPVKASKQRVADLSQGSASVRGIAAAQSAAFKVFEMGVEMPCADMSIGPSLSERECAASIAFGMEVVAEGADLIVLGNAGLGSATAAAAIARGLFGGTAEYWAGGRDERAAKRIDAVNKAATLHKDHLDDPLEVLRRFGGRDIAGMVGAILAARHQKIPVLLDGFVSCAAAAVLYEIEPTALAHCQAAHITTEPAHGALLDRIELKPILDFGVGIGDGSGAALTLGVLRAAAAGCNEL